MTDQPGLREVVAVIEKGWLAALEAIREAEAQRTETHRRELEAIRLAHANAAAAQRKQYQIVARGLFVTVVLLVLSVVAGLVVFGVQLGAQHTQADKIQALVAHQAKQRRVALIDRCRQTNKLTTGLRIFVRKVSPRLLPLAERTFHVEPDCARYAKRLTHAKSPPTPAPHR